MAAAGVDLHNSKCDLKIVVIVCIINALCIGSYSSSAMTCLVKQHVADTCSDWPEYNCKRCTFGAQLDPDICG